jgi:hypothetical protein
MGLNEFEQDRVAMQEDLHHRRLVFKDTQLFHFISSLVG